MRDEIYRSKYSVVTRDPNATVVRFWRSPVQFATLDEIDLERRALLAALGSIDRTRWGLLIDVRDGPMRNDPEFERAFGQFRRDIHAGFVRFAILVRTAVGKLQVQRTVREDGAVALVCDDEALALAHCQGVARGAGGRTIPPKHER